MTNSSKKAEPPAKSSHCWAIHMSVVDAPKEYPVFVQRTRLAITIGDFNDNSEVYIADSRVTNMVERSEPSIFGFTHDNYFWYNYAGSVDSLYRPCGYGTFDYLRDSSFYTGYFAVGQKPRNTGYLWSYCKHEREGSVRSGNGEMKFPNKNHYDGEWSQDCLHGEGEMTYHHGALLTYNGNWEVNRTVGRGTVTWRSGATISGKWSKNSAIVPGLEDRLDEHKSRLTRASAARLASSAAATANILNGNGTLSLENGDKYTGTFVCGHLSDGAGTIEYHNGDFFTGTFVTRKGGRYFKKRHNQTVRTGKWFDFFVRMTGTLTLQGDEVQSNTAVTTWTKPYMINKTWYRGAQVVA